MIDQYVLGLVDLYIDFLIHDNNVPAYRVLIERVNYFKNCKFSNKSLSLLILMQHLYALFFCWIRRFVVLFIRGGSLPSHVLISYGM